MSSECTLLLFVVLCFILAAGVHGGNVCTVRSSTGKEVLLGSNVTISCIFNKDCTKEIFRNKKQINYKKVSSREVSVYAQNLTEYSIFTCKCKDDPEPCGIDITPGYPPKNPQNVTCIRETEFGNVSCSWSTGRDTKILTKCQLRVQGDPNDGYVSAMNSTGFCQASFPIKSSGMSQLTVSLHVSNSLGTKTSGPYTFILSNIVKPSLLNISHVNCSSRWCHLHTDKHTTNLVEIKYKEANGDWKNHQTNGNMGLNITSLQPHTKYYFRTRTKINHTVGLWSEWSEAMVKTTQEEAPDKVLDVWYIQEPKPSHSKHLCFCIFWKELNALDAKGKIKSYNITVLEEKKSITEASSCRNRSICCSKCSVSVSAVNSKGQSPDRFIKLQSPGLLPHSPLDNGSVPLDNHTVALSWPRLAIDGSITEYVLHWYPDGNKEKFQWIRLIDTKAKITDLQPLKCYQAAVTALKSSGPVMKSFKDISTFESVPEQGPFPQPESKSNEKLLVKWSEISQEKRRGCLKKYTIYWEDNLNGEIHSHSVGYPKREHTISGLSPGQCYNLSVSAWTDAGQGPKGNDLKFCTPSDTEKLLSLVILAGGAVLLGCLFLLCICQFSSVQKRFLRCCQCLLPRVIPDPANSKCAKSYVNDQDEIKFYLQHCDSSMSEEPDNVEVEEVPYHHSFTCTYIKSFSQESSSSDATQITRTTDIMEDYISTHGAISGGEEEEDEEEETGLDEFEFLPSTHGHFMESLVSAGGKLTLDVVKIDCSEFLDFT